MIQHRLAYEARALPIELQILKLEQVSATLAHPCARGIRTSLYERIKLDPSGWKPDMQSLTPYLLIKRTKVIHKYFEHTNTSH